MKQWNNPELVSLDVAETANGCKPGLVEFCKWNDDITEFLVEVVEEIFSCDKNKNEQVTPPTDTNLDS